MSAYLPSIILLAADVDRLTSMGRRFRADERAFGLLDVLMLAAVISAIALCLWGLSRLLHYRERSAFNCPKALFRELCRAHGLSLRQRWLLGRLAQLHGVEQPAAVFLQPALYRADELPRPLRPFAAELSALRVKLFTAALPESAA